MTTTLPRPAAALQADPGVQSSVAFTQPAAEDPTGAAPSVANDGKQHSVRRRAPNKDGKYPARVLTPAEVSAMISRCSSKSLTGVRNRALLTLLYRSGLRISEALALRVSDINPEDHSIRVRETKSGRPQTRGYNALADDALNRWLDLRRARGLARAGVPLFCTTQGTPMLATYARNLMHRVGGEAGIEKRVHPHILRHSFAVEMEKAGETVTAISKALGHASPATTARYLDHLTNADAVKRVAAADLPRMDVDD